MSVIPSDQSFKTVTVRYNIATNYDIPYYELSATVNETFGIEQIYELPAVSEHSTAKKVLSYLKNRSIYSPYFLDVEAGMEARDVGIGNVITITAPNFNISSDTYKVQSIDRAIDRFNFVVRTYNASIYDSIAFTSPTDRILPTDIRYGPQVDTTPWDDKSASFDAEPNHRYRINTSGNAITMYLPSSPTVNDQIMWTDISLNFGTNNFIIDRNGEKIEGYSDDLTCSNNGEGGSLIYTGSTYGWKIML
jgi:hypothetical protein